MEDITKQIEENTLRCEYSYRGGGIEIALDFLGEQYEGQKMTAYQNYLGGGMLGSIQNDCTIKDWWNYSVLKETAEALARYFHELTRHKDDEWEDASFEQNQNRPASAY